MKPLKQLKKSIVCLLSAALVLAMLSVPALAVPDEASFTLNGVSGDPVKVTETTLQSLTPTHATFTYNQTSVEADFYSVKDIVEAASLEITDAHGIKASSSDGFVATFTNDQLDALYVYKDGTSFRTAVNGSAGNKWASNLATIAFVKDHVIEVNKKTGCTHKCAFCGAEEQKITLINGETNKDVYDCEIKKASHVDDMFTFGTTSVTATFYSMKSIFETAGIDTAGKHGIKAVASDGFVTGFTLDQLDNLYIYVDTDGTYRTAINGSAGNKWARDVVSFEVVADHVWFVKKGSCKHYCCICDAYEPLKKDKAGNCLHVYEDCGEKEAVETDKDKNCLHQYAVCKTSTLVKTDAKAATAKAEGNIAYWTCSACGKIFTDAEGKNEITQAQTVVAKLAMKANTIKAKAKALKVKAGKKATFKAKKAFTVKKNKGTVTYKKLKGSKKITVASNGKVTVKGLKKSKKPYKVKVRITAKGNDFYKAGYKDVILKVYVK